MLHAIDHLPYGPPFNVGTFLLQTVPMIQKIPKKCHAASSTAVACMTGICDNENKHYMATMF